MVSRTYQAVNFTYGPVSSSSSYGAVCKLIVTQLIALCSELSINTVISDTTSIYSVILNCMNSEFRIFIRNSGTVLFLGYINSAGTEVYFSSRSNMCSMSSDTSTGTIMYRADFCIQHSNIGGFFNWFRIGQVTLGYSIGASYAWGKSVELQSNIYTFGVETYSLQACTNTPYQVKNPIDAQRVYNLETLDGSYGPIEEVSPAGPGAVACQYTGASYYLTPYAMYAYYSGSPKIYFGHILWGGLYDLYILRNSSGNTVSVQADTQYAINGEVYMGCFAYMIIPEPAIFS